MKATLSFIAILGFFIFSLTFVTFGQDQKPTLSSFKNLQTIIELSSLPKKVPAEPTKKCSSIIEGLQFCTTTPFISINSGEHVTIDLSLQNMSEKPVSIIHGYFYDFYNTQVTDSKGNKIPSFREIILKKYKDGIATEKEIVELFPINSMPRNIILAPQQEYKVQLNCGNFYDFKNKGKFYIEMKRIISRQDNTGDTELSFGNIEVEVN